MILTWFTRRSVVFAHFLSTHFTPAFQALY
jgi:hypothetical protein